MALSETVPFGNPPVFDPAISRRRVDAASHSGSDELALLKYVYEHPSISTIRGNPAALIAVIDEFSSTKIQFVMTLGPEKRDHIIKLFAAAAGPDSADGHKVFLEFGAYVGYSAIALGAALRDLNPGQKVSYFSFESNPLMAAITSSFVELAGLKDVVHVHVGPASESLVRLVAEGKLEKGSIDFMMLDHWEDVYISDLQLCEEHGLLRKGSVVLADNVLFPGAPEYLAYVKKGKAEKSAEGFRYETKTEDFVLKIGTPSYDDIPDNDFRKHMPRFQPEKFEVNLKLVKELERIAKNRDCTAAQLLLGWLRTLSKIDGMPEIIPIPGANTVDRVLENSVELDLAKEEMKEIDSILARFEVSGDRYHAQLMKYING